MNEIERMFDNDRFEELMNSKPDETILRMFDLGPTLGKPVFDRILNGRIRQLLASGKLQKILDRNGKIRPSDKALQSAREAAAEWKADGENVTNADVWQEAQSHTLTEFVDRHRGELN